MTPGTRVMIDNPRSPRHQMTGTVIDDKCGNRSPLVFVAMDHPRYPIGECGEIAIVDTTRLIALTGGTQ